MIVAIIFGVVPLMFKEQTPFLIVLDNIALVLFIVDYILHWVTADYRDKRNGAWAFVLYPFTLNAIVDLLSILPSFLRVVNPSVKLFRVSRLLKILRFVKIIRYYEPLQIINSVLKKERRILLAVVGVAVFYVYLTAVIMFNVEYENEIDGGKPMFTDFYDAFYWAACTLTTVGYGDIYPVSWIGRLIAMVSALVGVAIIALPSGIITAGYMDELRVRRQAKEEAKQAKAKSKEGEPRRRRRPRKHGPSKGKVEGDGASQSAPQELNTKDH